MSDYMPDRDTVIKHFPQLAHVSQEDWSRVAGGFSEYHGQEFFQEEYYVGSNIPQHVVTQGEDGYTLWEKDPKVVVVSVLGGTPLDELGTCVVTFRPVA